MNSHKGWRFVTPWALLLVVGRCGFSALAGTGFAALAESALEEEEYDPWEPFNERMFEFNRRVDRYVLKPVAANRLVGYRFATTP